VFIQCHTKQGFLFFFFFFFFFVVYMVWLGVPEQHDLKGKKSIETHKRKVSLFSFFDWSPLNLLD
jgi:hypothetical protein